MFLLTDSDYLWEMLLEYHVLYSNLYTVFEMKFLSSFLYGIIDSNFWSFWSGWVQKELTVFK